MGRRRSAGIDRSDACWSPDLGRRELLPFLPLITRAGAKTRRETLRERGLGSNGSNCFFLLSSLLTLDSSWCCDDRICAKSSLAEMDFCHGKNPVFQLLRCTPTSEVIFLPRQKRR